MSIKAIIASTFLTVLFAGTSAIAGDNDHFAADDYGTTTESGAIQTVNYQSPTVYAEDTLLSGKK